MSLDQTEFSHEFQIKNLDYLRNLVASYFKALKNASNEEILSGIKSKIQQHLSIASPMVFKQMLRAAINSSQEDIEEIFDVFSMNGQKKLSLLKNILEYGNIDLSIQGIKAYLNSIKKLEETSAMQNQTHREQNIIDESFFKFFLEYPEIDKYFESSFESNDNKTHVMACFLDIAMRNESYYKIIFKYPEIIEQYFKTSNKSEDTKIDIMISLLKRAILIEDAKLILLLKNQNVFYEIAKKKMSTNEKSFLEKMESMEPTQAEFYSQRMLEFRIGEEDSFGGITYEGGLFIISEIHNRKSTYLCDPTILNFDKQVFDQEEGSVNEFKKYLKILKDAPKPIRDRFVIACGHWISGDISIDETGTVKILLIDSLGRSDTNEISEHQDSIVSSCREIFPQSQIYLDNTKRQHAPAGCSVFALDDVRHLFTIEKYLDPKYEKTGLFGYLEEHREGDVNMGSHLITQTKLPLPFMRTMQSQPEKIKKIMDREGEKNLKLGKDKKNAAQYVQGNAPEGFEYNPQKEKMYNKRLHKKLDKLTKYSREYLTDFDKKLYESEKTQFTLEGLPEKLAHKSKLRSLNQPNQAQPLVEEMRKSSFNIKYDQKRKEAKLDRQQHGRAEHPDQNPNPSGLKQGKKD